MLKQTNRKKYSSIGFKLCYFVTVHVIPPQSLKLAVKTFQCLFAHILLLLPLTTLQYDDIDDDKIKLILELRIVCSKRLIFKVRQKIIRISYSGRVQLKL